MSKDSVGKVLLVSTLLCVVCSVLVSVTAVGLKDRQQENLVRDKKRNVLLAAGLIDDGFEGDLDGFFTDIEEVVVDLATGQVVADGDPAGFDMKAALKDPSLTVSVSNDEYPNGIKSRPRQVVVYRHEKDGRLQSLIFPVVAKGLWSTMYGFLALESDLRTTRGLVFYEHGETPGLGGEVDSDWFKEQFRGKKKLFDEEGTYAFDLTKPGKAAPQPEYQADGQSGATITFRGVDGMLRYWLSDAAYGPLLQRLRQGG